MDEFRVPRELAELMVRFVHPWGICGGWAIDLYLNRVARKHKDIEVAVLRRDQLALRPLLAEDGWEMTKAVEGGFEEWPEGEFIELPVHTIWCSKDPGERFFEVLLNEASGSLFVYRRDPRVTLPLEDAFPKSESGLPILAPEIVLLYKAKTACPADDDDFQSTLLCLDERRRARLAEALTLVHPGHHWLESLARI